MSTFFENDETGMRDSGLEASSSECAMLKSSFPPMIKAGAESFFKAAVRSNEIWLSALLFAAMVQVSMPGKLANAFAFDTSCQ